MDYAAVNGGPLSTVLGGKAWRPGFFQRLPWAGLACLFGALLGVVACIAVLKVSDGIPIASWRFQPTVYLSVAYTITNILLAGALSNGVTISWWNTALGGSTQLGDLHRYWSFGTSPWGAITAGSKFNFIAFACLFVAITPINGPLLQRSSSVVEHSITSEVTLEIPAAQTIQFPTGYLSGRAYQVSLITPQFAPVVKAFYNGESIAANKTGCLGDGICTARLPAAGFAVACSSYSAPYTVVPNNNGPGGFDPATDPSVNGTNVFTTDFSWTSLTPGNMSLNVQYKDQSPCNGTLIVQNCSLQAATVEYPVVIDGNKSTIAFDPSTSIVDDFIGPVTDYPVENRQEPTMMGGLAFALQNRYKGVSHLRFVGAVGYELVSTGATGPQFAVLDDVLSQQDPYNNGLCYIRFSDPAQNLLQQARELMFRTAIAGGNSSSIQTVLATQTRTTSIYRSHYDFLAIAVTLTLASMLVILLTFNGFWRLGRAVSLSPIEIAKAFNAPILAAEDSNAEAHALVKSAGAIPVRYGFVSGSLATSRDPEKYGPNVDILAMDSQSAHLEIADASRVQPPK